MQQPVYLITDGGRLRTRGGLVESAAAALEAAQGAVAYLQLREQLGDYGFPPATDKEVLELAQTLKPLCAKHSAKLVINRRPDIAKAAAADGVHLGSRSIPISAAKDFLGPDFIIGYSAHSALEAVAAETEGANYLLLGPVFSPKSKNSLTAPLGLSELERTANKLSARVFALGGIDNENAALCRKNGAAGIAAISSLLGAENPAKAVKELLAAWHKQP